MIISLGKSAQYFLIIFTLVSSLLLLRTHYSTYKAELHHKQTQKFLYMVKYDAALKHLEKVSSFQPKDARTAYQQGRIFTVLYRFNQHPEYAGHAITAYQKAIHLNPLNGFHYDGLGWIYLYSGDYEQALVSFQEALKRDPYQQDYLYAVGYAYEKLEEFDKAIIFYERATIVRPSYPHRKAQRALKQLIQP